MIADFRALCAQLLDEIPYESPLTCLTRAALAEPESELHSSTLSPAAHEVVAAAHQHGFTNRKMLAAALRAAAQHLYHDWSAFNCIDALREIADELENNDD